MNRDQRTGRWRQLRGSALEMWGALSGSGPSRIAGRRERIAGLLQRNYGKTRDAAERAFDKWTRRR